MRLLCCWGRRRWRRRWARRHGRARLLLLRDSLKLVGLLPLPLLVRPRPGVAVVAELHRLVVVVRALAPAARAQLRWLERCIEHWTRWGLCTVCRDGCTGGCAPLRVCVALPSRHETRCPSPPRLAARAVLVSSMSLKEMVAAGMRLAGEGILAASSAWAAESFALAVAPIFFGGDGDLRRSAPGSPATAAA